MVDWGGEVAVIGGGIVGLAAAREVLRRRPGVRLVVLEKEHALGQHQTGHNSGVIHSGLYYAPGSLKARACVAGSAALMRYCDERGIPYERCGKVVVATRPSDLPRLRELHRRGLANGVKGLELIGPHRLRELEPYAAGIQALWSPNTGIVDFGQVAAAYADDVRSMGGEIKTGHEVVGLRVGPYRTWLETSGGEVEAQQVVACAGLYADRLAAASGAPADPRIVPFRGDYYVVRPERRYLVRNLIYPVPDPSFPFLGAHFTRRMDGQVWLGPNAVLAFAREGYRLADVRPRDLAEALVYRGFRRLAARYWKVGLSEMFQDLSKRAFLGALQEFVPQLEPADLLPGPSGVRAQALDRDGKLVDDIVVHRSGSVVHIRNAPSPAATSSLAIGAMIADVLDEARS